MIIQGNFVLLGFKKNKYFYQHIQKIVDEGQSRAFWQKAMSDIFDGFQWKEINKALIDKVLFAYRNIDAIDIKIENRKKLLTKYDNQIFRIVIRMGFCLSEHRGSEKDEIFFQKQCALLVAILIADLK